MEQVGHVDTSLLIDAPTVHLADQRVPVLPPCPPLPPLSPPPLLAETSFHAAGTTLQCPEGSIPSLGLTPSFHHTDHTIIGTQGPTQPLSSMVPRLLSHGGGKELDSGRCGENPVSHWSIRSTRLRIGWKPSAISSKS